MSRSNNLANNISAANNKATLLKAFLTNDAGDTSDDSADEVLLDKAFKESMREHEASKLKKGFTIGSGFIFLARNYGCHGKAKKARCKRGGK